MEEIDRVIGDIVDVLLPIKMGVAAGTPNSNRINQEAENRHSDREQLKWSLNELVNIAAEKGRAQIR